VPDSPPPASRSAWGALRPALLRLHFYAGVLVAPFILVAAVTGLLYVYTPQIEQAVYADVLRVPVGDAALPLDEQIGAATAAHPEGTLSAVRPGADPGASTRVLLDVPGLAESHRLGVFVDPYTGEVLGALDSYGSSAALPVRSWISEFHRHLHLGDVGRIYSELAASWVWLVAAGGVVLWVTRGRSRRRARRLLLPETGVRGRRRTMSWHGSVGLWVAVFVLAISATGLSWSQYAGANITWIREQLAWTTPTVATEIDAEGGAAAAGADSGDGGGTSHHRRDDGAVDHSEHGGAPADEAAVDHSEHGGAPPEEGGTDHGEHGAGADHSGHGGVPIGAPTGGPGADRVLEAARGTGLVGPVEITFPAEAGTAHTVTETQSRWPTQRDVVAVDGATGEVTDEVLFADHPVMAKLTRWGIDAHMGLLFGLPNQLVLTAVAAGLIGVMLWGYRMWWQRRPTTASAFAFGRPYPRGAWRAIPLPARAALLVAAVVVGYLMPLLGISLLVFVAVDLLLAARHRRRGPGRC
jgi:uncharacterized iron-regulated membrane protein